MNPSSRTGDILLQPRKSINRAEALRRLDKAINNDSDAEQSISTDGCASNMECAPTIEERLSKLEHENTTLRNQLGIINREMAKRCNEKVAKYVNRFVQDFTACVFPQIETRLARLEHLTMVPPQAPLAYVNHSQVSVKDSAEIGVRELRNTDHMERTPEASKELPGHCKRLLSPQSDKAPHGQRAENINSNIVSSVHNHGSSHAARPIMQPNRKTASVTEDTDKCVVRNAQNVEQHNTITQHIDSHKDSDIIPGSGSYSRFVEPTKVSQARAIPHGTHAIHCDDCCAELDNLRARITSLERTYSSSATDKLCDDLAMLKDKAQVVCESLSLQSKNNVSRV